jgi:hypothetical protein
MDRWKYLAHDKATSGDWTTRSITADSFIPAEVNTSLGIKD